MKKVSIKLKLAAWREVRNIISFSFVVASNEANNAKDYDTMLLCSLLRQVIQRIDVRIASVKDFTMGFTLPEALAIRQASVKKILFWKADSYGHFVMIELLNKIDQQTL